MEEILLELISHDAKDIDAEQVQKIAESINEQSLLHPITVRQTNTSPLAYKIVAGVKRFEAYKSLKRETIPCEIRLDITSDEQAQELSLHENLKRANLPWYEEVLLVKALHELRQAQHGAARDGRPAEAVKRGWGVRDTAAELGRALGPLSEDINLARAVARDPSLRNIKDRKTALRLVRNAAERELNEVEAGLPIAFEYDQVYNGPSAEVLKRFPDLSFDACITDPPWIVFKDERFVRDKETVPVFKEIYRVLKYNSFLYLFVGMDDFLDYSQLLPKLGFLISKTPLIWHKLNHLTQDTSSWKYSRDFELVLYAVKGKPVLTQPRRPSAVFSYRSVPPVTQVHPNEKPVALIENIVEDCSYKGNIILDPFAGSGSHLQAFRNKGRRFVGIERDHEIYLKIRKRLGMEEK